MLRVNGDAGGVDTPTTPESQRTESPLHFQASSSRHSSSTVDVPSSAASPTKSPHTTIKGSPVSAKAKEAQGGTEPLKEIQEGNVLEQPTPPSRPTSLPSVRILAYFIVSRNEINTFLSSLYSRLFRSLTCTRQLFEFNI